MADIHYKNFRICPGSWLRGKAGKWVPAAKVDYVFPDGTDLRGNHMEMNWEKTFATKSEAIDYALQKAKEWIDCDGWTTR